MDSDHNKMVGMLPKSAMYAILSSEVPATLLRLSRLHNSSKFADVTIYLGPSGIALPAHRAVLGTQSPCFEAALTKGFKETESHEFRLAEDSPYALWRVFEYMYCEKYSDDLMIGSENQGLFENSCFTLKTNDKPDDDPELLKHSRVYILADMYMMPDLQEHALSKFKFQLGRN